MAPKAAVRTATKPKKAKAAKRATRRAARKARKPKAPKAATKPRAPKAKAARKAMRAKKPKRVTRKMQTGSMRKVWNGTSTYTKGGLTKKDLMLNPKGRVVSKKAHKHGQNNTKKGTWMWAMQEARKQLGITGFHVINRGTEGVALYKKAKELMN